MDGDVERIGSKFGSEVFVFVFEGLIIEPLCGQGNEDGLRPFNGGKALSHKAVRDDKIDMPRHRFLDAARDL